MAENWFYAFLVAGLTIPFMIGVRELMAGVILLDIITAVFYGYMPSQVIPLIAMANIFAIAKTLLYKPLGPTYQS